MYNMLWEWEKILSYKLVRLPILNKILTPAEKIAVYDTYIHWELHEKNKKG